MRNLHWSLFIIIPLSWALDRVGLHSKCDDLDYWAHERGYWNR